MQFALPTLPSLRALVREETAKVSLNIERSSDLVLAANELATNSVKFGGGSGRVQMWQQDGFLICEISDGSHFDAAAIIEAPPHSGRLGGRGLWMVSGLCDRVQVQSSAKNGTVVRLHMKIELV